MHGDADDVVPIIQGEIMFEALQAAGVESEYVVIKGTSHDPTLEQAEHGLAEALRWFETHLGPDRP